MVTTTGWMRNCKYDLRAIEGGGFIMSQSNYLRNLLEKREIHKTEPQPVPKIEDGPDEEDVGAEVKHLAQALTGELMWLSTQTRPDISCAVGLMSRMLHRRPRYVTVSGHHVLKYLKGSMNHGLRYQAGGDLDQMTIMVDASYAHRTSSIEVFKD